MSTTAQAATIKSIYLQALERSDLRQDKNSSLYQAEFQALVTKLVQLIGTDDYRRWYDQAFPGEDDDRTYTWAEKKTAVEAKLRELRGQP